MSQVTCLKNRIANPIRWAAQSILLFLVLLCIVYFSPAAAANDSQSGLIDTEFTSNTPIPHSNVSRASGEGIVKAMLSCATSRYAHAVLGDAIEAGCLIVEDEDGLVVQLDLPEYQVFEDLIPRIADVNLDGQNDVVLVRSDARTGAALAVYTLTESGARRQLAELAATPAIGTAYRWLAPVGIADFNNDGLPDIAYVQTPHIGGILRVWSMIDGEFIELAKSKGYSNHSIGDTRVSTAKIMDINNDGVMDIALPDQRRRKTVWLSLHPKLVEIQTKVYELADFD